MELDPSGKQGDPVIEVAVGFDAKSAALVTFAIKIAKKINSSLRLVHVVEPWGTTSLGYASGDASGMIEAFEGLQEGLQFSAQNRLEELASSVRANGISCECKVLWGQVTQGISRDAATNEAKLILCSTTNATKNIFLRGISTAVGLAVDSAVPVMIIGERLLPMQLCEHPAITIWDDLSTWTDDMLLKAYQLATVFDAKTIHHVHVLNISEKEFADAFTQRLATGDDPYDGNPNKVYQTAFTNLRTKLEERSPLELKKSLAAAGVNVIYHLLQGQVLELTEHMKSLSNIMVFGRHRAIHTKPLGIGKAPLHRILQQDKPVVVIGQPSSH